MSTLLMVRLSLWWQRTRKMQLPWPKGGRREIKTEKRKDLGNGPQAMETSTTTTITTAHSIQSPLQLISSFRLSISVLSRRTFSVSVSSLNCTESHSAAAAVSVTARWLHCIAIFALSHFLFLFSVVLLMWASSSAALLRLRLRRRRDEVFSFFSADVFVVVSVAATARKQSKAAELVVRLCCSLSLALSPQRHGSSSSLFDETASKLFVVAAAAFPLSLGSLVV